MGRDFRECMQQTGTRNPRLNFQNISVYSIMQSVIRISPHPIFSRARPNSCAGDTNLKLGVVATVRANREVKATDGGLGKSSFTT